MVLIEHMVAEQAVELAVELMMALMMALTVDAAVSYLLSRGAELDHGQCRNRPFPSHPVVARRNVHQ